MEWPNCLLALGIVHVSRNVWCSNNINSHVGGKLLSDNVLEDAFFTTDSPVTVIARKAAVNLKEWCQKVENQLSSLAFTDYLLLKTSGCWCPKNDK